MGFFSNLIKATVETVTLPVSIVKDAVEVAKGEEPNHTKEQAERIGRDIGNAFNGK